MTILPTPAMQTEAGGLTRMCERNEVDLSVSDGDPLLLAVPVLITYQR